MNEYDTQFIADKAKECGIHTSGRSKVRTFFAVSINYSYCSLVAMIMSKRQIAII